MRTLIPILVAALLSTEAIAQQIWREKPVLCEQSEQSAQEFYREMNLYPLIVGAGVAVKNRSMQQVPVVTYVLYNEEENYMMVVEYHQDEICVLAIGAGVEFGTDQMNDWLGIQ